MDPIRTSLKKNTTRSTFNLELDAACVAERERLSIVTTAFRLTLISIRKANPSSSRKSNSGTRARFGGPPFSPF